MRTFLNRSSISKILHHISFPLINLGLTMPIKLYSIKFFVNVLKKKISNFSLNLIHCLRYLKNNIII